MVEGRLVDWRARKLLKPGVWEKYVVYKRLNPREKCQILDSELIGSD